MIKGILLSGQGAQKIGMGKDLYTNNITAKKIWDQANDILGFNIQNISFNGPNDQLVLTKFCQPALYIHSYVLYRIINPKNIFLILGLSLGEITAHAIAGTYDFETGLRIVAERGKLMQESCDNSNGAMASIIGGTIKDIQSLCKKHDIQIANFNCPGQVVISGEKINIDNAIKDSKNFNFRRIILLNVNGAYHSKLMLPASFKLEKFLQNIIFKKPNIGVVSNTTCEVSFDPEEIKKLLVKQIFSPVRWEESMLNAVKKGINQFYEFGPNKILKGLSNRIDPKVLVYSIDNYQEIESFFLKQYK